MAASVLCLLSWGKNERRYQIINEADPCVGYKQLGKVCYTKGQGTIFYFLHRTSKRVVFSCLFIFFNIFLIWVLKMQCSVLIWDSSASVQGVRPETANYAFFNY